MDVIFFSYAHADEELRDELEKHLAMLKRQGRIRGWHDRKIQAGHPFDDAISEHMEKATIVLLLVSADFLASEYCYGIELRRAMERHRAGEARVIPVILRPCDWQSAAFGKLQACPKDAKPVTRWTDRDEAWLDVVRSIKAVLPGKNQGQAAEATQKQGAAASRSEGPRSSNLRLRKEYSEANRNRFLKQTFEYMARFFENSLQELEHRNEDVETDFTRVDAEQFTAAIYRNGKAMGRCRIRLNPSSRGFGCGITFSSDDSPHSNSYNENLSVEADDQSLFLRPMGMGFRTEGPEHAHLTEEGASELYWSMLIERLQE